MFTLPQGSPPPIKVVSVNITLHKKGEGSIGTHERDRTMHARACYHLVVRIAYLKFFSFERPYA